METEIHDEGIHNGIVEVHGGSMVDGYVEFPKAVTVREGDSIPTLRKAQSFCIHTPRDLNEMVLFATDEADGLEDLHHCARGDLLPMVSDAGNCLLRWVKKATGRRIQPFSKNVIPSSLLAGKIPANPETVTTEARWKRVTMNVLKKQRGGRDFQRDGGLQPASLQRTTSSLDTSQLKFSVGTEPGNRFLGGGSLPPSGVETAVSSVPIHGNSIGIEKTSFVRNGQGRHGPKTFNQGGRTCGIADGGTGFGPARDLSGTLAVDLSPVDRDEGDQSPLGTARTHANGKLVATQAALHAQGASQAQAASQTASPADAVVPQAGEVNTELYAKFMRQVDSRESTGLPVDISALQQTAAQMSPLLMARQVSPPLQCTARSDGSVEGTVGTISAVIHHGSREPIAGLDRKSEASIRTADMCVNTGDLPQHHVDPGIETSAQEVQHSSCLNEFIPVEYEEGADINLFMTHMKQPKTVAKGEEEHYTMYSFDIYTFKYGWDADVKAVVHNQVLRLERKTRSAAMSLETRPAGVSGFFAAVSADSGKSRLHIDDNGNPQHVATPEYVARPHSFGHQEDADLRARRDADPEIDASLQHSDRTIYREYSALSARNTLQGLFEMQGAGGSMLQNEMRALSCQTRGAPSAGPFEPTDNTGLTLKTTTSNGVQSNGQTPGVSPTPLLGSVGTEAPATAASSSISATPTDQQSPQVWQSMPFDLQSPVGISPGDESPTKGGSRGDESPTQMLDQATLEQALLGLSINNPNRPKKGRRQRAYEGFMEGSQHAESSFEQTHQAEQGLEELQTHQAEQRQGHLKHHSLPENQSRNDVSKRGKDDDSFHIHLERLRGMKIRNLDNLSRLDPNELSDLSFNHDYLGSRDHMDLDALGSLDTDTVLRFVESRLLQRVPVQDGTRTLENAGVTTGLHLAECVSTADVVRNILDLMMRSSKSYVKSSTADMTTTVITKALRTVLTSFWIMEDSNYLFPFYQQFCRMPQPMAALQDVFTLPTSEVKRVNIDREFIVKFWKNGRIEPGREKDVIIPDEYRAGENKGSRFRLYSIFSLPSLPFGLGRSATPIPDGPEPDTKTIRRKIRGEWLFPVNLFSNIATPRGLSATKIHRRWHNIVDGEAENQLKQNLKEYLSEDPSRKIILYHHGGAFILTSSTTMRSWTYEWCKLSGHVIFVLDYDNAPHDTYLEDQMNEAIVSWEYLRYEMQIPANRIILWSESAGSALQTYLLREILSRKRRWEEHFSKISPICESQMPAAMVLISPWVNLEVTGESSVFGQGKKFDTSHMDDPTFRTKQLNMLYADETGSDILNQACTAFGRDLAQRQNLLRKGKEKVKEQFRARGGVINKSKDGGSLYLDPMKENREEDDHDAMGRENLNGLQDETGEEENEEQDMSVGKTDSPVSEDNLIQSVRSGDGDNTKNKLRKEVNPLSTIHFDYTGLEKMPIYINVVANEILADDAIDFAFVLRDYHSNPEKITLHIDSGTIHAHLPVMVPVHHPHALWSLGKIQQWIRNLDK